MKKVILITIYLALIMVVSETLAQTPIPDKRTAIYNFKLDTNFYYSGDMERYLRVLLEAKADKYGIVLLARQENYQTLQQEKGLEGIDPATKAPSNQFYGATAVIDLVGRLETFETNNNFSYGGYGISNNQVRVIFRVIGKVIDTRTGQMKIISTTVNKYGSGSIGARTNGDNYEVKLNDANSLKGQLISQAFEEATEKIAQQLQDKIPSQESWPAPSPRPPSL